MTRRNGQCTTQPRFQSGVSPCPVSLSVVQSMLLSTVYQKILVIRFPKQLIIYARDASKILAFPQPPSLFFMYIYYWYFSLYFGQRLL